MQKILRIITKQLSYLWRMFCFHFYRNLNNPLLIYTLSLFLESTIDHAFDLLRMLKNPVLFTNPYLSPLLAPAIISLSSSSVISSPRSSATLFSSLKLICPSLSRSNKSNAFSSSYAESFSLYQHK